MLERETSGNVKTNRMGQKRKGKGNDNSWKKEKERGLKS